MNSSSNGPNIFIIDDDQDALMSLVRALKAALPKVYIHAAAEITAALKLIKEVKIGRAHV